MVLPGFRQATVFDHACVGNAFYATSKVQSTLAKAARVGCNAKRHFALAEKHRGGMRLGCPIRLCMTFASASVTGLAAKFFRTSDMRFLPLDFVVLTAFLACGHAAFAAPAVKVTPGTLHPNLDITASGTGFADNEAIDVYIDTSDTALVVSSATGTLSASVLVPANTQPGKHYITAIGRKSGDAAQAAFTVSTPWQEQGFGSAGRAWNTWENTLSPSTVGTLGVLWVAPTDPLYSAPMVANGRVYVALPSGVESINATTGQVVWTTPLVGSFYSSPAVSGSSIYVASIQGGIYALNTSGTKLWGALTTTGFVYASPMVSNGVVYIGDSAGTMHALNATTGATIWSTATSGDAIYSTASVANGVVYVGSYSGAVYAFNAATGAQIWNFTTGSQIRATPAVVNGLVYIASFDGYLYALAANSGALVWSSETNYYVWSSVAVADNAVYGASAGGIVYAYDPRTGAIKWSLNTGQTINSDLSVANGVVYVGSSDGTIYALNDASGALLWSANLGNGVWGRLIVSDGVLYVNSQQGSTFAFAPQAGNNLVRRAPSFGSLHPDYGLVVRVKN
jgi:outer membrane protein assembly factor BamB